MYSRVPVIPPARKRTEFDYNYLSPEDRRRLERPMVRIDDIIFKTLRLEYLE